MAKPHVELSRAIHRDRLTWSRAMPVIKDEHLFRHGKSFPDKDDRLPRIRVWKRIVRQEYVKRGFKPPP